MTSRGKIVEKQLGYDLFSNEPLAPTATANLTVFCASIHNCCVQVNTSEANSLKADKLRLPKSTLIAHAYFTSGLYTFTFVYSTVG